MEEKELLQAAAAASASEPWLGLLRLALDDAHEDHDEACDCYERLCDGLDGTYRFPERSHGPPPPPVYGCKTWWESAIEDTAGRLAEAYYSDLGIGIQFRGLSAALDSPLVFGGVTNVIRGPK